MKRFFTSESVTEGHPDKVCDRISDAILDAILEKDKNARVAVETFATIGTVIVAGEITTKCYVDIQDIVRKTLKEVGYTDHIYGLDYRDCGVFVSIHEQSPDISQGVDKQSGEIGAGDQGTMFGYACRETPELMPLPIMLAHKLTKKMAELRKSGEVKWIRPDGKSQVTVEYEDDVPKRIDEIVISIQHDEDVSNQEIRQTVINRIIKPICSKYLDEKTRFFINETGRFVIGGPRSDTGLTGRKIIVDTYGGMAHHGGGCFSGKDATKVDRSAAYMARYIAKNVVASGLADKCEVQISYSIGVSQPVSVYVNTFGTGKVSDEEISNKISKIFDLRPASIIKKLDLLRPIYKKTSAYGHFGRNDADFTWEKLDMVDKIKQEFNVI